jgi:hypothetical protein
LYDSNRELIEALRATPDVLAALLRGVSQAQAQAARGGDENWSVVEVVCHLRDAEAHALNRMRAIRDQDNPAISGYDQEALAREHNYAASDLAEALDAFLARRAEHLADLAALSPAQWERQGQHTQHGPVTIQNHTLHTAWHDAVHLAQIARQLAPQS